MERSRGRETAKAYRARLRGGPADGTDLAVPAESDGEPPESIDAGPDDSGMYLLAGLPNPDGSTPYWWIAADTGALRPADPAEATWTLVSIGDDGSTTMWHQHGEDAEPVPLAVEPVATDELPTHIGRAGRRRVG